MKADVRFLGEYIVTGAFFWIAQLILCLALFGTDVILTKSGGPPLEAVMNSISNGLGMRNTGTSRKPNRPWNPHFYAIFTQVHNTL